MRCLNQNHLKRATNLMRSSGSSARLARNQQAIVLVQTVEAIRMYGALHDGKLPLTLGDLPVPAPMEPFTGKPVDYEYHRDFAVLNGHKMPGMQYRLVLRFADKDK